MQEQSYARHRRFDPVHHFVGVPLSLANFIAAVVLFLGKAAWPAALLAVTSFVLLLVLGRMRRYATQAQDRVIRIEENFRHFVLTGSPLDRALTLDQIIALRFASDEEFPALCERAVREQMKKDEIKRAIRVWRADTVRV